MHQGQFPSTLSTDAVTCREVGAQMDVRDATPVCSRRLPLAQICTAGRFPLGRALAFEKFIV